MATAGARARDATGGRLWVASARFAGVALLGIAVAGAQRAVSVAVCVTVDGAECLPPRAAAGRT
jgi:hypothetical protein